VPRQIESYTEINSRLLAPEEIVATIEIEVCLNEDNGLILPDDVVKQLGLQPGSRLVLKLDEDRPNRMEVRPIRRSYAGLLNGMSGDDKAALEYVRTERESWDEPSPLNGCLR
jgi:antitoxin component of MazEF toxin-antitoxin module